jgi:hypothetical protein
LRPEARVDLGDFEQSDELAIREWGAAVRWALADGRVQLGPRCSRADYTPPAGNSGTAARIRVQRPDIEGRWRINDAVELNAGLTRDLIVSEGPGGDHGINTWDAWATWWPRGGLRLDLSHGRRTFDSELTLRQGLKATQTGLPADFAPDDRSVFVLRTQQQRFSDGNRHQWAQAEGRWRAWPAPRLWLGLRHTQFDFRKPGQPGYYNPAGCRSTELLLQAAGWAGPGLHWELRWLPGREREDGSAARDIRSGSGSASLAWTWRPGSTLELAYDHSTSCTQPGSGFARGITRLSLKQGL